MEIVLQAKSSSGGSYDVLFRGVGDSIRVFCNCRAGVLHQFCKHKLALIKGDTSALSDPTQAGALSEIHAWSQFSDLKKRTEDYERNLARIERAKSELAREERELKVRFAHGLSHGFE